MAHEINNESGKYEAFYTKEPAWHRLGTVVKEAPTSQDAIQLAGLNWDVTLNPVLFRPNSSNVDQPSLIEVPRRFVTVREDTNTPLGLVGSKYKIIQNLDAFSFLDSLICDGSLKYESAGALRNGSYVWLLAKFPEIFEVSSDDISENYILLANTHDGKQPMIVLPTNVRVVCMNTLSYATRTAQKMIRIRHKGNIDFKIDEARGILGVLSSEMQQFNSLMKELSTKQVVQNDVDKFIIEMFPAKVVDNTETEQIIKGKVKKIRERVEENFNLMGTTATKGTAYGLLNSITEYVDHQRSTHGKTELDKERSRFDGAVFGTGNVMKQKALQYLTR